MFEKFKNWLMKKKKEKQATGDSTAKNLKNIIRTLIKALFEVAFMFCEDDCKKCSLQKICYVKIILDEEAKKCENDNTV